MLLFKLIYWLQVNCCWVVMGILVQNKFEDFVFCFVFLCLKLYNERSKFIQYIIVFFKVVDFDIVFKFCVLNNIIMICCLKDEIEFLEWIGEIVCFDFMCEECRVYNIFKKMVEV